MRHAGVLGLGGIVLALLLALGIQSCRLENAQERHAAAALRASNLEAANDTTRALGAKAAKVLGDSLAGVERRAVQQTQRADALDRALARERISRTELTTRIATLTTSATSTQRSDSDTGSRAIRRATFDVRKAPYTVHARVSLPPLPAPGTLDSLRVALDSAQLDVRLGCGPAKDGIRPATASVVGPVWLSVALSRVEQSPELCRSPALQPPGVSRVRWFSIGTGIGAGLCFFFCRSRD